MKSYQLKCRERTLTLSQPLIMAILNVTPDSFSDGGDFLNPETAVAQALNMISEGASLIDIGGESTRPGAQRIPPDEQIKRVLPVIKSLASQTNTPISIDTTSSQVAQAALDAGASIINDVSALRFDPEMAPLAARENTPVILMHMLGDPHTMQTNPTYEDVVRDVKTFLSERIDHALSASIDRSQIIIDPGIGFGKTVEHNLTLLRHINEFHSLDVPLLVGPSRKSFIGKILDLENPKDRLYGTAAAVAWCAARGVHILRVHDVKQMNHVLQLTNALNS